MRFRGDLIELEIAEYDGAGDSATQNPWTWTYCEDEVIVDVINKAQGMVVHPAAGRTPHTWSAAFWTTAADGSP